MWNGGCVSKHKVPWVSFWYRFYLNNNDSDWEASDKFVSDRGEQKDRV